MSGVRHRLLAGTSIGTALVLAAAGCSGGGKAVDETAKVTIAPGNGTGKVRPDSPISIQAVRGKIENVSVSRTGARPAGGEARVEGVSSVDGTQWRSRWTLDPGAEYQVTATALGADGKTKTVTSSFTTAKVKQTVTASVTAPKNGETVGVGMPIMLHFDHKISNRDQVERALEVRSTTPVEGAWRWYTDQDVFFRTKKYWPRHTKVRLIAHMSGVRAARSMYGAQNVDLKFKVGDEHVSVASEDNHHMIVKKNGKKIRTIPTSMGRGGVEKYTTTDGVHLAMEKAYMVVMDSSTTGCPPGCPDYYREDVYWTVRISDSGEFVHSAPWSVGSQGYSNVSHGCVNISPSNAIWFYHFTRRGDVVKVTGTSRPLSYDNGWGFWQMPWKRWVKGSALKQPVTTARLDGSAATTAQPAAAPPAPQPPTGPPPRAAHD